MAANLQQATLVAQTFNVTPGRWVYLTDNDQILGIEQLEIWVYKRFAIAFKPMTYKKD